MLPAQAPVPARAPAPAPPPVPVPVPVALPALHTTGIAQGGPGAAEDDLGPTRIHPAPPPYPPRLDQQRAGLLTRAAHLTQIRADAVRAYERWMAMADHHRRAEAASLPMCRRVVGGCALALAGYFTGFGLLIADGERQLNLSPGSPGETAFENLSYFSWTPLPLIAGTSVLRWGYHAYRRGSTQARTQAQGHSLQLATRLQEEEQTYATHFERYRQRELLALRREASDVVMAGTDLPRELALLVMDYEDPDSEILGSLVPLPRRSVEIVLVD